VTTTIFPVHAAQLLRDAIDHIFAPGLDDRMIASLPGFWKLYYQAVASQADYRPSDPAIYRQGGVDQKARLLSPLEAPSNEYAQANGVAGMALYHVVIGPDGKPQEIVVGRPIGFGLDESAAETIRKASFQPAMKDGKAVPVLLDVVVQFRIYSKRTNQPAKPDAETADARPKLPGPYSVVHP
jgi:TonB family protein